jgi:hypothetical protein
MLCSILSLQNHSMAKKTIILAGFIILKFLLNYFIISPEYNLQRDEYLHLDQANHLAWGYLSVPPFSSWISWIIQLLGNGIFWVKFFPCLFGAMTIYIVWKTVETLNGNLFAQILAATCLLFSVLLRLNILWQPNSFEVLAFTTVYFMLIKYIKAQNTKWLFYGAVFFALGFLNKYNIVFLLIGLVPALLLSKERTIFLQPKLYWAIGLALLLVLPNLLWQFNNHFPVVHHMKVLAATQLVHVDRIGFLKNQLMFFIGSLVVIIAGLYALLFYKPFQAYRFFFWSLIFSLAAFMYFKAKDYYAIGIYPIYIAFGAAYLGELLKQGWKRWLQPVAIAIPLLLFIPFYHIGFPNKTPEYIAQHSKAYEKFGLLRWEDGKNHLLPQDFADMLGWKELAIKVDSVYSTFPNNEKTLVLCDNYGQAGAINFYSKLGLRAVSFNADYVNWFDLSQQYENLIRVKEHHEIDDELTTTSPFFEKSILADSITNKYAREFGTAIFAFTGAKIDIRQRLQDEIDEKKKHD